MCNSETTPEGPSCDIPFIRIWNFRTNSPRTSWRAGADFIQSWRFLCSIRQTGLRLCSTENPPALPQLSIPSARCYHFHNPGTPTAALILALQELSLLKGENGEGRGRTTNWQRGGGIIMAPRWAMGKWISCTRDWTQNTNYFFPRDALMLEVKWNLNSKRLTWCFQIRLSCCSLWCQVKHTENWGLRFNLNARFAELTPWRPDWQCFARPARDSRVSTKPGIRISLSGLL